ncbi:hypothetical protein [Hydrotalea sp.]|uniref:hypothetical protein n=1 Tax=Hydrotalea sp. TaxID=2881279 RepID=UPI002609B6EA|nr:hypothetical protein [Hydrotalea sp.]
MKKILIALLLLSVQNTYGQDYKTRAANKPSESAQFQDEYIRSNEDQKANDPITKNETSINRSGNLGKMDTEKLHWCKHSLSGLFEILPLQPFTSDAYNTRVGKKGIVADIQPEIKNPPFTG